MRLIDADELIDRVGYIEDDYGHINEEINNMPTIDAEPIRHGHWINDDLCSCCGNITEVYEEYTARDFDYCPWCGAKMDEVNE